MDGDIPMKAFDVFLHIYRLLVGRPADTLRLHENPISYDSSCIMFSDFGWTVSLPTYGDSDPFDVMPGSAVISRGVPTNAKTMERKNRVRDAGVSSSHQSRSELFGGNVAFDRGEGTYSPRCISPVHRRDEYYGLKRDDFNLMTRFTGEQFTLGIQRNELPYNGLYYEQRYPFQVWQTYRDLHEGLWNTITAPPCQHKAGQGRSRRAKLGPGVATVPGPWTAESFQPAYTVLPERIAVVLVKGDARARWLAIGAIVRKEQKRRTMLRGHECCEDCAVLDAASRPGQWLIII